MKNIGIILASGSGSRFKSKIPKQFVRLAGKPVIQYTLETFEKSGVIDEIIVVTQEEYVEHIFDIINAEQMSKVSRVIIGGKERYDSTKAALDAVNDDEANLIIHDAVRPFITHEIILRCTHALQQANAVDVVVDATDTIVEVRSDTIQSIPDRRYLKRGQTPQGFKKSTLSKAYALFMQDEERIASDDCGIVLKYLPNEKILTVSGEESNFKITHQQDIYLADNIIKDGLFNHLNFNEKAIKETIHKKSVAIIGASSGIGKDLAEICAGFGACVLPLSRRMGNVDVADKSSVANALDAFDKNVGRIDYVINTSGFLIRKPLMSMSDTEIEDSHTINYVGVINVARAAFPYLKKSGGMLINFASSSYTRGRANYSLYSSSKAAVVNFTQAIAEEWMAHNIRVNAISPERTATPMRYQTFGHEPPESLLSSWEVAKLTTAAMSLNHTGQIYSIKNDV